MIAAHAEEAAWTLGVRLLCLTRPGYGSSSLATPSLRASGSDAVAVADAAGVEEFAVLGVSGGAPFAVATALAAPARVTAVGITVGVAAWRVLEADNPALRDELTLIELFEAGQPQEALRGYRRLGAEWFTDLLVHEDDEELMRAFDALTAPPEGHGEDDLAFMGRGMRRRFAADLREALRSFDGLYYDNVATGRAWDIDPTQVRQPCWLWYGERDSLLGIQHAHWWRDHIPHSRLTVLPEASHGSAYLPTPRWVEMLTELRG